MVHGCYSDSFHATISVGLPNVPQTTSRREFEIQALVSSIAINSETSVSTPSSVASRRISDIIQNGKTG
ncbi:hypothetical protein TNCT_35981 [Trichonephila clavata]|uniref:Uncharacterized protein n=1 Tax=Trichonephila clavata TaxID=2740835 RepID=A0A8X6GVY8_TRICU|nr:hypothetical protein TNCT_35981 [Trichonephila clavata]